MEVTFYGVRGSCPCPSEANRRYGGNTACVALTREGRRPIVFDLGTGLRAFGETQPLDGTFRGTALVTHIHWDHIQGLPFFPAADRHGAQFEIYGPEQEEATLTELINGLMRPPYFPVTYGELRGDIHFHEVLKDEIHIGDATVIVRPVPHIGPTVGYRVDWDGSIVTYISDHQAPVGMDSIADSVMELVQGADVLIHDAQYTDAEFEQKAHWGHCTVEYAVHVAREGRVKKLVLFHHDPSHGDDYMDLILQDAQRMAEPSGIEVVAAFEGLKLDL